MINWGCSCQLFVRSSERILGFGGLVKARITGRTFAFARVATSPQTDLEHPGVR